MTGEKMESSMVPPPASSLAPTPASPPAPAPSTVNGDSGTDTDLPLLQKSPAKSAFNEVDAGGSDDQEEKQVEEGDKGNKANDRIEIEDGDAYAESDEISKLAQNGFYLIEAVRKKRFRKGEPQYFIKWRGYPESVNTWEPWENLKTAPEAIAAFEASLLEQPPRKRKINNNYSLSQTKKKKPKRSPVSKLRNMDETAPAAVIDTPTVAVTDTADVNETTPAAVVEIDNAVVYPVVTVVDDIDYVVVNTGVTQDAITEDMEIRNNVAIATPDKRKKPVEESAVNRQETTLTGKNNVANCSEEMESVTATLESGRGIRASKRKSGPVNRFISDPNPSNSNDVRTDQLPEKPDKTSNVVGVKNTSDIIKIIKPVNYRSLMSGNTMDVCVTFLVKRSDGKELTVDSKFLKSHCPLLLLEYYERRVRYDLQPFTIG